MPPVPYDQLRSALALGLPYLIAASICLAAGLAAIGVSLLRSRDRLLIWIGIFATLYGLRLFLEIDLVRIAFSMPSLRAPIAVITYLIPIPYVLFLREVLGRGWKSSIQIWLWVQLVFAPIAILSASASGDWDLIERANNILIVGGSALALVPLLLVRSSTSIPPAIRYSIFAFLLVALTNNLGLRIDGRDPEPLGFLVLIGGLAYTAAQRAISREQKLAVVESELATARRIQTSILPRALPALPGLRLAASYRPMTAVAGDFYDFLPVDQRRVTVLVADVSGHGVPAALIASMLKVAFAVQAAHATDPAAILTALNSILNGVLDGQFVTAICTHIDLAVHAITYAGAGHPPAILVRRASGDVLELAENGLILGPFRNVPYANACAPFDPGDRLLLYTDGILEATFSDGEPFGLVRLREFAAAQGNSEPAAIANALLNTVSIHDQEDDLTIVVLEAL
jgi:sigma-B regulation protein RsbU (phosphoserine phosphatase)